MSDSGYLYAFLTFGHLPDGRRVLKVGRTSDWSKRIKTYVALNTPDPDTVLVCPTDHAVLAEERLVATCRLHLPSFAGNEWFVADETAVVELVAPVLRYVASLSCSSPPSCVLSSSSSSSSPPPSFSFFSSSRIRPDHPHVRAFMEHKLACLADDTNVVAGGKELADEYNAFARERNLPTETAVSFGCKLSLLRLPGVGDSYHTNAGSARRLTRQTEPVGEEGV